MSETAEAAVLSARLDAHERRIESLEKDDAVQRLWERIDTLRADLAELRGQIRGYLLAGTMLGAVVAVIAEVVISGLRAR